MVINNKQIIIFILLLSFTFIYSEEAQYYPPELLNVWESYDDNFINNYPNTKIGHLTKFYPLGWSKDSKFAYITESYYDGVGPVPIYTWIIVDLITDYIIFQKKILYNNELNDTDKKPDTYELFQFMFNNHITEMEKSLLKYNIIQQKNIKFNMFPLLWENNEFNFSITFENTEKENFINNYNIMMTKTHTGSKIIYQKTSPTADVIDIKVLGYFINPYEPRIAVLLVESSLNIPWDLTIPIDISGCSLEYGYKQ